MRTTYFSTLTLYPATLVNSIILVVSQLITLITKITILQPARDHFSSSLPIPVPVHVCVCMCVRVPAYDDVSDRILNIGVMMVGHGPDLQGNASLPSIKTHF